MSKRSADWNENFSQELLSSKNKRREFFFTLLEKKKSWREALRKIVKTIGIKEYAELSGFKASNLQSQLSESKDIRLSTLMRMLKPIGVSLDFIIETEEEGQELERLFPMKYKREKFPVFYDHELLERGQV